MALKYLQLCVLVLAGLSISTVIWFLAQPSPAVIETVNWMYFYEYEPVHKKTFAFTLRERVRCKDRNPFLVILVTSRPNDVKARQAIRKTWGSNQTWWGQEVITLFLVGHDTQAEDKTRSLTIEEESILFGDIIRQDFLDTYNNLTLKTIMAFRWTSEFCSNTKYIMKADSDVFVNTGNLVRFLLNFNSSESLFTGFPLIDNNSYRGFYKKAFISYEEYPFRLYPPYCSGLGYVLSSELALRIHETMSHIKPIKFEDAYIGICLQKLGVNVYIPEDTELFFLYKINFNICRYKHLIAVHGLTSSELIEFWQDIKNSRFVCK
ncbi:UDP-GalNAc:beta-1,3-N-acetylgalactosaminyltransferase 1 [Rhinatrema bivittatum]|uniref:UDP-GalNAc:beta-1, 3-N-acetylgalactosaminyltransferase 1 n=1 Tax=Rhinatrema bivittatum TaxID=194408 RepID=UPI00112D1A9F|nr:UDP-GalNAc:beta-1,3-N-acetylgalactosaminyltransferase 1 [Rhinatrema bivittatum]XP_029472119.1 UDP-GalNAc:beta-1,3-N-acetylgalactosaminyltransferase 1 [Rhinatrema bivittatum]XP_029472120.1 UDP-GalNAc:beta-1,3-N-acetylgalactosaminyltransferase 1 [Rhinatrema bivittatum]XP_029472121.1 UDP-GalNAc:beta-1,3-N-acetylgalactosaminyltransferase 1 [Rhinatrema bivittatum]XP_029472122.1 UDP-GalNAc:beta-1,3-N-acetylgalactosaminyltransferase 1 [Rhinatrema bivittatum]